MRSGIKYLVGGRPLHVRKQVIIETPVQAETKRSYSGYGLDNSDNKIEPKPRKKEK